MFKQKKMIAIVLGLNVGISASAMENEPTGFRSIEWGASASSAQGLMEVNDEEALQRSLGSQLGLNIRFPLKMYRRVNEKREFDGTPVDRTLYTFYRDQFMAATITYQSTIDIHPQLGRKYPDYRSEANINGTLQHNFGASEYSKLSFLDKLKPSNSGLSLYAGEATEINNKCVVISHQSTSSRANCELQFRSAALYKQSKKDFMDYIAQSKENRDDAVAKEKAREQAKPDF